MFYCVNYYLYLQFQHSKLNYNYQFMNVVSGVGVMVGWIAKFSDSTTVVFEIRWHAKRAYAIYFLILKFSEVC